MAHANPDVKSIGVIHERPHPMGGAENVMMNTLEALEQDYEITIITAENFDIEQFNSYFNTSVDNVSQKTPELPILNWEEVYKRLYTLSTGKFGVFMGVRRSLFYKLAVRNSNFDLLMFTQSESPYGESSIQYIHEPTFLRYQSNAKKNPDNYYLGALEKLVSPVEDKSDFPENAIYLANSNFIKSEVNATYGIDPTVCHPPVQTEDIQSGSAGGQLNRIITVGRVAPFKRQHLTLEIVADLRERGVDIGLSIVGPPDGEYGKKVKRMAEAEDWATFYGAVSREKLVDLLAKHKFGLHCKAREHFGIVVAEMVAAGVIPVVPNSGGQTEIVNDLPELTWSNPSEATENLEDLIKNDKLREEITNELPNIKQEYGTERFQNEIRSIVHSVIENLTPLRDSRSE